MKQDYLWDKTGNDSEIEGLENLLSAYKYAETEPPVIPVRAAEIERKRFWNIRFAIPAFAAATAMLVVFGMIWFNSPPIENNARTQVIEKEATPPIRVIDDSPNAVFAAKINVPAQKPVKQINRPKRRPPVKPSRKEPILTREEKYAYGQLMLALAITGEKLKIVQDTVNGVESPKTNFSEIEKLDK